MPTDRTPLGDEMAERLPERKFPQDKSGGSKDEPAAGTDIKQRPALPDRPTPMAADIEDEESDPVIDNGPGIADGEGKNKAAK